MNKHASDVVYTFDVVQAVGGTWIATVNGFQWSPPGGPFDHQMGVGTKEWPTSDDAIREIREYFGDTAVIFIDNREVDA